MSNTQNDVGAEPHLLAERAGKPQQRLELRDPLAGLDGMDVRLRGARLEAQAFLAPAPGLPGGAHGLADRQEAAPKIPS